MTQYKTGTVKVLSGEGTVEGTGTLWAANVEAVDLFKMKNESVIYQVSSITDNTHLELSTTYNGVTRSGEQYQITRDFTPNLLLPEVNPGDIDWPNNVTRALRLIDAKIDQGVTSADTPKFKGLVLSGEFTVPVATNSTGVKGTLVMDTSYLYVCKAANSWGRIALTW
jgi:hypothetical protein